MSEHKYTLIADFDGECDISDCDNGSTGLWYGVSHNPANDNIHTFTATYCKKHEKDHADLTDGVHKIGMIEEQE